MKYMYLMFFFILMSYVHLNKSNTTEKEVIKLSLEQKDIEEIIEVGDRSHQEGKNGGVYHFRRIRKDSTLQITSRNFGNKHIIDTLKTATEEKFWNKIIVILNVSEFSKLPMFSSAGINPNHAMNHRFYIKTKDTIYHRMGVSFRFMSKDFDTVKTIKELIGGE